jgi:penicillin amidase
LSELLGERTLDYDRKQRERGYEKSAIEKAEHWLQYPDTKNYLESYVRGINDYINTLSYKEWPLEYKLLAHEPTQWSTTQSALVVMSMAISLCLGEDDLEYSIAREKLSAADYAFLFPEHNRKQSAIIASERKWDFAPTQQASAGSSAPPVMKGMKMHYEESSPNGSNNWAVAGKKTKNGYAIVANDPHLGLTLPNIWYEIELHTPQMHVHGVTLPGLPFVVLGFNDSIAWGSTNSGQDVLDWYTITWQDSSRRAYQLDGQFVNAILRPEVIKVRGQKDIIDTIRYTHWGPVTHSDEHRDMAMKWIGHQKANSNDFDYLVRINQAKGLTDYREAIHAFQYPAQNKVFGSVQGDIAISVAGVMPVRPKGLGESLTAGDQTSNDWQGYIPFEHSPYIINPTAGFVGSANQHPADTTYPFPLLGKRYFDDYRGRMVNNLLAEAEGITPESMMSMQQNNYNLIAADILPALVNAVRSRGCFPKNDSTYLQVISNWNFENHRDSLSPILFDIWMRKFAAATWDELDTLNVMYPETWRLIEITTGHPDYAYFDATATEDVTETMEDIACMTFSATVDTFLTMAPEVRKNWGTYKHSAIPHLARLPQFGVDFISTSGGRNIINAMSKSNGPSWRLVAELSNPPKAWVNYPGGQSGDPADPHYKDFLEHYFDGHYYPVQLLPDASAWKPVQQLTISPK